MLRLQFSRELMFSQFRLVITSKDDWSRCQLHMSGTYKCHRAMVDGVKSRLPNLADRVPALEEFCLLRSKAVAKFKHWLIRNSPQYHSVFDHSRYPDFASRSLLQVVHGNSARTSNFLPISDSLMAISSCQVRPHAKEPAALANITPA
jgi:hypothetical protein